MPFPGVYRAKVIDVYSNGRITVQVPQLFGDVIVTITRFIDTFPRTPTLGWVLFESGDASFPVWLGSDGLPTDSVWVQLTQAEYDALDPPNPTVLYLIVG